MDNSNYKIYHEMYSDLVNSTENGVVLYKPINNGTGFVFKDFNKTVEKIEKIKKEEVIGKEVREVFPLIEDFGLLDVFKNVYKTGISQRHPLKEYKDDRISGWKENYVYKLSSGDILVIYEDVTHEKQAQEELFREKELLRITLQSIGDGVITTDELGNITSINKVGEELTGWKSDEAEGKPLNQVFNIINEFTKIPCENPAEKIIREGCIIQLANHTALISKNGDEVPIEDSGAPIIDEGGKIKGVVIVFRDCKEKKRQEEEVYYYSYHDILTGLFNRTLFEKEMERFEKEKILPISLIVGDVNGLKLINDAFGHKIGDKLLVKVANILRENFTHDSVISRWGGDEFAILLPGVNYKEASAICKSVKEVCMNIENFQVPISISLGCAELNSLDQDLDDIMKEAEDRMYRKKMRESKSTRSSIITSLKKSLYEKSCETEEHAQRLVNTSLMLGKAISLPDSDLDKLYLLSLLHDIGKIGISDEILKKPGKLNEEEWAIIKKHPEIGYRIAQPSMELSHIAELILCHHEWWNGRGYPQGLKKYEIPILSRLIAVVDAYDVMTHERPYKKALSSEEAIGELRRCSGTQFDPFMVDAFIKAIKSDDNDNNL